MEDLRKHNVMESQNEFMRVLPVALSVEELMQKATELSQLLCEIWQKEENRRAEASKSRKETQAMHSMMNSLVEEITNRAKRIPVKCVWRYILEENRAELIRCDTLTAIESRAMSAEERQMSLL